MAEPNSLPVSKPNPLIKQVGGVGARPSILMSPQQRADILTAHLRKTRFIDIDGDSLNGADWREWQDVRRLLSLTS